MQASFPEAGGEKDVTGKKESKEAVFFWCMLDVQEMEAGGQIQAGGVSPTHVLKRVFLDPVLGKGLLEHQAQLEACRSPGKIQSHRGLLDLCLEMHMLLLQLPW